MTDRFHFNPETGRTGKCSAQVQCRFGQSEEQHGSSRQEARANYERTMEGELFANTASKKVNLVRDEAAENELLELDRLNVKALELSNAELEEAESKFKALSGEDDPEATENAFQEFRRAALRNGTLVREKYLLNAKKAELGLAEPEEFPKPWSDYPYKFDPKIYYPTRWGKMEFHHGLPEDLKGLLAKELSAFSDYTFAEAYEKVNGFPNYEETELAAGRTPLDRDSYIVSLFQEGARNQTRDRVFVDIETTGFDPRLAEVIEVGIVRISPDGEVKARYDERFDLESSEFRDAHGVGPTEIHKITGADLAGKPKFSNPEVQKAVGNLLNDPEVIVGAHNDSFEKKFFNLHLEGFWESHAHATEAQRESNRAMQDTMLISTFLEHSTDNNRLQGFAEGNGVPYENAHSALADAEMTAAAYVNFRKKLMALPLGQRPLKE